MRWIVGDIQGCAREFDDLLKKTRFDPANDELWCLGDLINRGPDSLAVLQLWRDVGGRSLLGNHEVNALLAFSGSRPRKMPTLQALFESPDAESWMETLRGLPILVSLPCSGDGPDVWLVHAGLHPAWRDLAAVAERVRAGSRDDAWFEADDVSFATRVRCCDAGGAMCRHTGTPDDCPPPFVPWDTFYGGSTMIVHGHWARRGYYRGPRTMGLDSGCVYGGLLTGWCQEEDRIVQVPAR